MIRIISLVFTSVILFVTLYSCSKADPITYDCTGLTPTYTQDVKPILDANCVGCHSQYGSYSRLITEAPNNSFMGSMQHLSGYEAMPRGKAKLSDAQLKTISCWIHTGMTN